MADVKPGQVYVPGVSARSAQQLLAAASKAGLDPRTAVRTTDGGFIVPEQIAPAPAGRTARILPVDPPPEPKPPAPRGRTKKSTKEG